MPQKNKLITAILASGITLIITGCDAEYSKSEQTVESEQTVDSNIPSVPNNQFRDGFEEGVIPNNYTTNLESGGEIILYSTTNEAFRGTTSLEISFTEGTGEKKPTVVIPYDAQLIPKISKVSLWVKIPQITADAGFTSGKIYAKDADGNWLESNGVDIEADTWTKVEWIDLPTQVSTHGAQLNEISELGLQLYAADDSPAITDGKFYIDEVLIDGGNQSIGGSGISTPYITYQGKKVYFNGANVAWLDGEKFGKDFGSESGLNEASTIAMLADIKAAGGNVVRWWYHLNGVQTPVWDANTGLIADAASQKQAIDDLEKALDLAQEAGIYIMPCLWSFDMLAQSKSELAGVINNNYNLLTDDTVRQSYIDNFLLPLIERIAGHPALIAIDLFNEPENMTESWFIEREGLSSGLTPSLDDIHTTSALFSAAIHNKAAELNKEILVTTGPKSLGLYNLDDESNGGTNYYSDERMVEFGGEKAPLDFYAPHYYDDMGKNGAWSPFYHQASYWNHDKPIVIGEFFTDTTAYKPAEFDYYDDPIGGSQLCVRLSDNQYAGGLSWQWTNQYRASVLDCIRAQSGATPPEPEGSTIENFENNSVPASYSVTSDTGSDGDLSISNNESHIGNQSLVITFTEPEGEKKIYLNLPIDSSSMPEVGAISLWVKLPQSVADGGIVGGKLFAKIGSGWVWTEGPWVDITADTWTKVSWVPETTLTNIQALGFQLYANEGTEALVNGEAYIDYVVISADSLLPDEQETLDETGNNFTYDFEDGNLPSTLSHGSDSNGTGSLTITEGAGIDGSYGAVMAINEPSGIKKPNFKQNETETLTSARFMVNLSNEAAAGITGGKVYVKTGEDWTGWTEGDWISFDAANTWVEMSYTSMTPLTEVKEVGISFYGDSDISLDDATITIDNITIVE